MQKTFLIVCLALMFLSGCGLIADPKVAPPDDAIACPDERPEVCTQHYDPVCAMGASGAPVTYSNACHACADTSIVSYRVGACEAD